MVDINDYQIVLPPYLSEQSTAELLADIEKFPEHYGELYTSYLPEPNILYQGDGISGLPMLYADGKCTDIKLNASIVLSNTCDMDNRNKRKYSTYILYCPIFKLTKFKEGIESIHGKNSADSLVASIKKQACTSILYLPAWKSGQDDGIVFLDRIYHIHSSMIDLNRLSETRLFSLSNFGFYLLLLKLSVHFCRMQEKVDRYVRPIY